MAVRVRITNFEEDFDKEKVVTNPKDYVDKQFTEDGIFSETIFGNYETKSMDRGWIDFDKYYIIHPLLFPFLKKVIPKLLSFIEVEESIDLEGEKVIKNENAMGLWEFKENIDDILEEYANPNSPEYNFIMKNRDNLFINKFPILPVKIRPSVVVKNTVTGSKVNRTYKLIIQHSNKLKDSDVEIEGTIELNKIMWKLQYYINILTKEIEVEFIRQKKGWFRNNMIGSKVNYSARSILGPLVSPNTKIDEVAISYLSYLELYKKLLVNMISKSKGISLREADRIWKEATIKFSPEVYKYMVELNKKTIGGQYILLNRNPTINISSVLRLKVAIVKSNYDDNILQISNAILNGLGADYDGRINCCFKLYAGKS